MTVGEVPVRHTEEFYFDPNTADSTQLMRLGLPAWMIRNIYRYRARGGVYRSKRDFAQTYGLTKKDYLRLEPYIRISDDYQPASTLFSKEERDTLRYPAKLKDGDHVVLNTADTTQLMKVPGIGSYYAKEIVRHGKWIGGYVSVDQLDEIEGFPQSAKKYFVVSHPTPQRLNINKLTLAAVAPPPLYQLLSWPRRLWTIANCMAILRACKTCASRKTSQRMLSSVWNPMLSTSQRTPILHKINSFWYPPIDLYQ